MNSHARHLALIITLAFSLACSDDDENGKTTPDSGTVADTGGARDTGAPDSGATCKSGAAINACTGTAACKATRDCSLKDGKDLAGTCVDAICTPDPAAEAKIEVSGKGFTGTPNLACLTTAPALPTGPATGTVWGQVTIFGLEETTVGVKVEIFDATDTNLATPLGSSTAVAAAAVGTCTTACATDRVCMNGKCVKPKDSKTNPIGYWEIKGIPTNKLLIFRASGTGFVQTVQYNLWMPADEVGTDGKIYEEAYVVSELSKKLIAAASGVGSIPPGAAAIAGEIHDCDDEVIKGATVSLSLLPQKLAYFDGNGMPDTAAAATYEDGLYAAVNITPPTGGDMFVSVAGLVGGKAVKIANYKVKVLADAITVLTTTPWYPGMK